MKAIRCLAPLWAVLALGLNAGTLAIFDTSVGPMYIELYDKDKPQTVANFIRYIQSGRFDNSIVQRWEPQFVIQGGGYYIDTNNAPAFRPIQTFGNITNEFSVGAQYSNTYGTIAMARQSGQTNSASSQWFLNLTNNAFLDNVDGGFTVFGKIIAGTNNLNKFYPPPAPYGIYRAGTIYGTNDYGEVIYLDTLPVLSLQPTFNDLIYVGAKLVECKVRLNGPDRREISWNSVAGITNRVEVSTNAGASWSTLRDVVGDGTTISITDSTSTAPFEIYRVRLLFN